MTDIIAATAIAFSFLTTLPMPRVDWTPSRLRYFPAALPLVGLAIGALGAGFFARLQLWEVSPALRAALMTCLYLIVTGGLHMDGLMDTCDAVFSRRDRDARLEILSDTHTGAFAVMGCAVVLLLKTGIFSELLETFDLRSARGEFVVLLTLVPVYSRTGAGLLLYLPFAREDGLARTLGSARAPGSRFALLAIYAAASFPFVLSAPFGILGIPLMGIVFLCLYGFYCVKVFGGVTGDLLGAFIEVSETLMLLTLVAAR
ncbi:MAG: adenosylcobinamide-GDP ribazoletransferase [Synergistaceae bacterium]|jgi:adenosylcobinamide-GDP ribazoletransferase|nr:adenosylcobinamide-GDP ribazoletransferase [Synergistaceae bacterium]